MRSVSTYLLSLLFVCAAAVVQAQDFPKPYQSHTFINPVDYASQLPIDNCLYPAKQCTTALESAAADRFCKAMNYGGVLNKKHGGPAVTLGPRSSTYIQGTGEICNPQKFGQCIALTRIKCGWFTL